MLGSGPRSLLAASVELLQNAIRLYLTDRIEAQRVSELKQGNPLDLSISLSGGKETNQDCPSNGE